MSFPRYPAYKPSGVEWLGDVPEHWEVCALKYHFAIVGGSTPKSETEAFWDGDVLWATPSDLSKLDSLYLGDTQRKITDDGLASCGTSLVPADSIILSTRAPIGSLAIAKVPMCTNQGCKSLVPTENSNPKYFAHLLSISSTELNIRGKGTTFLELSSDELGAFTAPLPPPTEQTAIAAFLDQETGKIDALVAEQRRLMELLKEKRQAVISHAVTRGLNPKAKLKPSGIEWLGDVPEDWEVKPLKYAINLTSGGTPSKDNLSYWDGEVPWASSKDLKVNELFDTQDHITQLALDEGAATLVPAGTILTVVRGMILLHTFPVVLTRVPMAINQDLKAITPKTGMNVEYLAWLLRGASSEVLSRTDEAAHGTKVLRLEAWLSMEIPTPPLAEQTAIVAHLERKLAKFDTLTAEAQRAIDLLQERRTALISAAVTGQIDVREAAKP